MAFLLLHNYTDFILWIMGINKDETHVLIKNTMKTRIFSSKSVDNPVHSVRNFVENLRIS